MSQRSSIRRGLVTAVATAALATVLALSGCAGSAEPGSTDAGSGSGEAQIGGTLTIGQKQAVNTLDPATSGPPTYVFPAYEPLIYQQPDGSLIPALATEWSYTDDTNTSFEVKIREGVTFADGGSLDAAAVKASLERFLSLEGNPNATYAGPVESIDVVDDYTIVIHYSTAFPVAALSLSQDWRFGLIVSPDGLADEEALATETHGAGQYVLDSSATVDGSSYTFDKNENYWSPEAVKFDTIDMKVISDPAAQLAALESGEIDYANNAPAQTVTTAVAEGFQNAPTLGVLANVMLVKRDSGPLADERVREAISLALDRGSLASAVFGEGSEAQSTIAIEGQLGNTGADPVEQNIDEAKQLLADAGYPDGVSITLLSIDGIDPNFTIATAVQSQLAEAGITAELTQATGAFDNFIGPLYGGEADAAIWQWSIINTYYQFSTNLIPAGALGNPLGGADDELSSAFEAASSASEDELDAALQAVVQRYDDMNWTVPVASVPNGQLFAQNIGNLPTAPSVPQSLNIFSPDPDTSVERVG